MDKQKKIGDKQNELNQLIIEKLQETIKLKEETEGRIKMVMRVPRLYNQYLEIMKDICDKQQLQIYLESKKLHTNKVLTTEKEQDCVKFALEL